MIVSVAEEMNPTRRNTMEDAHVVRRPGSWGAPDPRASFVSVMDGHGGRRIADYLEDHLASNVAGEWSYSATTEGGGEGKDARRRGDRGAGSTSSSTTSSSSSSLSSSAFDATTTTTTTTTMADDDERPRSKKRRHDHDNDDDNENITTMTTTARRTEEEMQGDVVRLALERAFLLTDVRSRLEGIITSGATVACCVVIPNYRHRRGNRDRALPTNDDDDDDDGPESISIHAANAGDARAVLSSGTAVRRRRRRRGGDDRRGSSSRSMMAGEGDDDDDDVDDSTARPPMAASSSSSSRPPPPPPPLPPPPPTTAIRLTRDHKSTDPDEVDRIVKSGGFVVRGRVLGVLAVARSIGDHGLKEYVIGRPHVSSTVVRIVDYYDDDDGDNDGDRKDRSDEDDHYDGKGDDATYTDGEFLIVACDGLWDVIGDQEAVDLVRWHACGRRRRRDGGREGASSFLVGEALRRGSADNITVVVYWL
ncbi:hypothetical protein ACHAW5_002557 [Stephanodiscus triporus]|uniref:PPM-type phosphatase domain-containing protein n=1 Tax=Stephanodiscus triporus TaxID=2934178 RepID=A0ABD3MTM5_9STRA